jgi:NADH pyrophosphatase NudC (nudix superfamily)
MIGCIGKALGKEVHMDEDEMEEVRYMQLVNGI